MIIGRVIGNVWSTKKNPKIDALRLLFVQPLGADQQPNNRVLVAADEIGAGVGEIVIVARGGPAMQALNRPEPAPVDAVVLGIVDSMDVADGADDKA